MVEKLEMDHRAQHDVYTNGTVRLYYKNFIISIASDGFDVLVFTYDHDTAFIFSMSDYDLVSAIAAAKDKIDSLHSPYLDD